MDKPKFDFAAWLGIATVCLVLVLFLVLVKFRPDFFRGMTLTP